MMNKNTAAIAIIGFLTIAAVLSLFNGVGNPRDYRGDIIILSFLVLMIWIIHTVDNWERKKKLA